MMAGLATLMCAGSAAAQPAGITPAFDIWDVELGAPVTQIPGEAIALVACGTNGGPPSTPLASMDAFEQCRPEASGLREVHFAYDDEADYIARALELEYKVLSGGTSIYAHPVVLSVLVDPDGIVQGIRAVTDNRASLYERRNAASLGRNLKARFSKWSLACEDIPPRPGENPMGSLFLHEVCTGRDAQAEQTVLIETYYYRKRGQEPINRETQELNLGYFTSGTRLEVVAHPYEPTMAAAL
jgi:hypothetical protein